MKVESMISGRMKERNPAERAFVIDNLLVRIHFIIVMIRWTGLAPWEFEFPFSGSLIPTFLVRFLFLEPREVALEGRVDDQRQDEGDEPWKEATSHFLLYHSKT